MDTIVTDSATATATIGNGNPGDAFVTAIDAMSNTIFSTVNIASQKMGLALFGVFVGVWFAFFAWRFWLGGMNAIVKDLIPFLLKALIPLFIITYTSNFDDWIKSGAYGIASELTGASSASSSQFNISSIISNVIDKTDLMFSTISAQADRIPIVAGNFGLSVTNGVQTPEFSMSNGLKIVLIWIVGIAVAISYFLSSMLIIVQLLAAMLIFPLAIALAPLFAPFIIGWIFEGFFKQWMAFLFLGFFAIILSGVFLSAFGQLASALNVADFAIIVLHEPAAGSSMPGVEFVWINILSFFLYSIILLFLSRLIWTIASGLSGGFSLSSGMNVNLPSRRKQ